VVEVSTNRRIPVWVAVLGLVLLGGGGFFFYRTVLLLEKGLFVGSLITTLIGGIVFMSGISLIKIYLAYILTKP